MSVPEMNGFFATLKNAGQQRAVCNVLRSVTFQKNQTICVEGDPGHCMYNILWGRVSVSALNSSTQEDNHIRDLGPGDNFGQLALIADGIRSTTIIAREFTVLQQLDRVDYDKSFRQADEDTIIEKVEALGYCPLFHSMDWKKLMRIAYNSEMITVSRFCLHIQHYKPYRHNSLAARAGRSSKRGSSCSKKIQAEAAKFISWSEDQRQTIARAELPAVLPLKLGLGHIK